MGTVVGRPTLTTDRVRLDPLTVEHLEHLLSLDLDPEVMRYITGRALTREESIRDYLPRRTRDDADERGLGYWCGFDHATGDFLGWWCLGVDDEDERAAELGYRLSRTCWGRGLASEGAAALLTHGFDTVGLDRIWADTMAVNTGSRGVMRRLGLLQVGSYVGEWDDPLPGWEQGEVVYALTRAQWRAARDWDAQAPAFDDDPDHGLRDPAIRDAWRSLLAEHLPPSPARVADLGCGTGTLSALLGESGYDVTGVDLSPDMLAVARTKAPGSEFVVGDASAPPLEAGEYDVVLCRHVLWALPDPVDALRRWSRLLAPGGRMVLIEGRWWTGGGLTAAHTVELFASVGRVADIHPLTGPEYWGRDLDDERYLCLSPR